MPEKPMIATKLEAEKVLLVLGMAGNVPSPCISVCSMDAASGLCEGCLRTLDEIACCSTLGEAGKRAVWGLIGQRVSSQESSQP
jgi:predicted Fe-S protein YdhL (DUF1289 family)